MGRKSLSTYKSNKIKKLVNEGKTIKDISTELKISTATVANYRAYFKNKGEIITPKNQTLSSKISSTRKDEVVNLIINNPISESKEFNYIINGTKLTFDSKPKEIKFYDNKIIIEY